MYFARDAEGPVCHVSVNAVDHGLSELSSRLQDIVIDAKKPVYHVSVF